MKALSFVTYCQNLSVINIYQLFHFQLCIEMFYSHMKTVYFMNLKARHQLRACPEFSACLSNYG